MDFHKALDTCSSSLLFLGCSLLMQIKSGCEIDGSQEQGPQGDLGLCGSAMPTFSFLLLHSPGFTASAAPGERLVTIRECAESAMAAVPSRALRVTRKPLSETRCSPASAACAVPCTPRLLIALLVRAVSALTPVPMLAPLGNAAHTFYWPL